MSPTGGRVVHTGQAVVDVVLDVAHLPASGSDVMASAFALYAGGTTNVLAAAARSGATTVHAGALGTGPYADLVRAALLAEGTEVPAPPVPGVDTGFCVVMIDPDGERTFVTAMGAERRITAATLDRADVGPDDLVCVTAYTLLHPDGAAVLLDWLEALHPGATVVLDPGALAADVPAASWRRLLARTDVWTSNLHEARTQLGDPAVADGGAAADALAAGLPRADVVVVRDGPLGCWVAAAGTTTHVPGHPQVAVDTNGAGDCHTGVLLAGRLQGLGWVEAAVRADVAAAVKVTRRGPATAPTAAEIDAFLRDPGEGPDGLAPVPTPGVR